MYESKLYRLQMYPSQPAPIHASFQVFSCCFAAEAIIQIIARGLFYGRATYLRSVTRTHTRTDARARAHTHTHDGRTQKRGREHTRARARAL